MSDPVSDADRRRRLPSVDRLLTTEPLAAAGRVHGRALAVDAARETLADARERAAQGNALAFAAGKVLWQAVQQVCDIQELRQRIDAGTDLLPRPASQLQRKRKCSNASQRRFSKTAWSWNTLLRAA